MKYIIKYTILTILLLVVFYTPTNTSAYQSVGFNYDNQEANVLNSFLNFILPQSNAQTPDITTGLVGHWTFDETSGNTAGDSSPNNNTGTLTGGPMWSTGNIDGALSFDGIDDLVDMGGVLNVADGEDFTITGWFKRSGTTKNRIVGKRASVSAGAPGYHIRVRSSTHDLEFEVSDGTDEYSVISSTTFTDGEWHHFTAVWDDDFADKTRIYIDGVNDNGTKTGTIENIGNLYSVSSFVIGAESDGGDRFNGSIDDVRVYNRKLTQAEITELYNYAGTPPETCTSFTYSNWTPSTCPVSETQTRTIASQSPSGCAGGTPESLTQSCTYISSSDTQSPTTPTNLSATPISSSQINLSWNASTDNIGVTGYRIYRDGSLITTVTGTNYSNTGLTAETQYTYMVSAYDAAGNNSGQTAGVVATTQASTPGDYYVSITGNDNNPGTNSLPFRTIQHAADVARAGDTVIVNAGTYYERIIINYSGTASDPIVFEGEKGSGGEHLTIIDGSDTTSGWVLAPEVGAGVYKTTAIGYEPYTMVVEENGDTYDIAKLCHPNTNTSSSCDNWATHLAKASDVQERIDNGDGGINGNFVWIDFWDGIEALYSSDGATTYIRFRNYDDPNQKVIRSSKKGAAISIWGRTYITVKDFQIRATDVGVGISKRFSGGNWVDVDNIIIENNKIINGRRKISLVAEDSIIRGNVMYMNGYAGYKTGHVPGPWLGTLNYEYGVNRHLYLFYKYPIGYGSSVRDEEGLFLSGSGHKVYDNEIYETMQGIHAGSRNTEIYNNIIHDDSSIAFFFDGPAGGVSNLSIHDNLIYNINMAFRFGNFDIGNINNVNIYRNKVWNPSAGRAIFYHHNISGGVPTQFSDINWYHNSFSGGDQFSSLSSSYDNWGSATMQNVRYINNIISSPVLNNENVIIPNVEYSWTGGDVNTAWYGDTNILEPGVLAWNTPTLHNFQLTGSSPAINSGVDLSQSYTIGATTYPALSGMSSGYFTGSAPDMGAVEYTVTAPSTSADLNSDGFVNSIDWSILNTAWGTNNSTVDLNNDSTINSLDWGVMSLQWSI